MTYEVQVTGNFKPSAHYLQTIMSGAIENKLPKEYIDSLSKLL
ncbi:MAG: gamma-glutamylcyclotransferase [Rhizobacter sp.]|nr:gamma-glutamylcyclotransferase [Bacteriovorax sp.]